MAIISKKMLKKLKAAAKKKKKAAAARKKKKAAAARKKKLRLAAEKKQSQLAKVAAKVEADKKAAAKKKQTQFAKVAAKAEADKKAAAKKRKEATKGMSQGEKIRANFKYAAKDIERKAKAGKKAKAKILKDAGPQSGFAAMITKAKAEQAEREANEKKTTKTVKDEQYAESADELFTSISDKKKKKKKDKAKAEYEKSPEYLEEQGAAMGVGPEFFAQAPTWDTKGFGTAGGYDVPEAYKIGELDDPAQVAARSMSAQNMNPYRRAGLHSADAASASARQTAEDALARTGGISAADRMNLANQSNRAKIAGKQGVLDNINMLESKNLYDTQAANIGAANRANEYNVGAQNLFAGNKFDAETEANRSYWSAGVDAKRYLADQQNMNDRNTIIAQNRAAEAQAKSKYARDLNAYEANTNRYFTAGQQQAGADAYAWNMGQAGKPTTMEHLGKGFTPGGAGAPRWGVKLPPVSEWGAPKIDVNNPFS